MRLIALLVVLLAGCRVTGAFVCETNDQCRSAAGPGLCDPTTFYCTFADEDCASGQRYGDNAGGGLAGSCADEQTVVDAPPMIDAPPFDPSTCPADFTLDNPELPNAKYKLITPATGGYSATSRNCVEDAPGIAHPANVSSRTKAMELIQLIYPMGGPAMFFIGVVQGENAATPVSGWMNLDGTMVPASVWAANQPDDTNGVEDGQQQVAWVTTVGLLEDVGATSTQYLICECDGVPIAPAAQAILDEMWGVTR